MAGRGGKYDRPGLDAAFAALSDPTRRAILARLVDGESSVKRLAAPLRRRLPGLLKHLAALEAGGLVESRKQGRTRFVRLRSDGLAAALGFLGALQAATLPRFDAAASYIDLSDMDVT